MAATQFVVVRHVETEWNRDGRIQGHLDSPLTSEGITQAQTLARRLSEMRFDLLVSSDLGRASATAAYIATEIVARPADAPARAELRNLPRPHTP